MVVLPIFKTKQPRAAKSHEHRPETGGRLARACCSKCQPHPQCHSAEQLSGKRICAPYGHALDMIGSHCRNKQLQMIANTDHTPVWYDMVGSYTLDTRGAKCVPVKTGGMEKAKITVQLTCTADGGKLPPLLIFKANGYHWLPPHLRPGSKTTGTAKRRSADRHRTRVGTVWHELLNRLPDSRGNHFPPPSKVRMVTQPNANSDTWCTRYFLSHVWKQRAIGGGSRRSVLIWDSFAAHKVPEITQYANDRCDTATVTIQGGLTPIVQPLDKAVNKVCRIARCGT